MKSRAIALPILAITYTLAAPVFFVVQTVLADQLSAASMTAGLAVGVFVLTTVVTGIPRRTEIGVLGRAGALKASVAGVLGVFGTQYLVLSHRYSDAPPGSEVIFFTTAAWGVLVVLAAYATVRKPASAQLVSAAIALFGTAAVLANWERPSSFSPFVRYPAEDLGLLVAGAAWAAFSVLIADLGRRHRLRAFLPIATGSAAIVAIVVAAAGPDRLDLLGQGPEVWLQVFVGACTLAAMVIAWSWLTAAVGVTKTSALLFLPAVVLTILGVFERQVGAAGPSPLLWSAVVWASAATIAGAVGVVLLSGRRERAAGVDEAGALVRTPSAPTQGAARWFVIAALGASALAAAAAAAALWLPALTATVQGTRGGGEAYSASWTLPGAETPAGWIAFFAVLLTIVAGMSLLRGAWRPSTALVASAIAAVAIVGAPWLLDTPLRTWTRWVPGEIQQDYGTEYARLTFARAYEWPVTAVLVLGGLAALLLAAGALLASWRGQSARDASRTSLESDGGT